MRRPLALVILLILASLALIATGQQPDAAPNKPDGNGVFNVRDFGAKGDGLTDDTAAIQRCLDAAIGEGDPAKVGRVAKGPVYLPPGTYTVTKPLRAWSVNFLRFHGAGNTTRINPSGTMDAVLDLNGVAFSSFGDFMIQGIAKESIENVIYCYTDGVSRTTSNVAFHDILIRSVRCVTGIRVGKLGSGVQCDLVTYRNLAVEGGWSAGEGKWYQNGYHFGSGTWANNLVHTATHLVSNGWQNGATVLTTNFALFGGSFGSNAVDFNGGTAYFSITGVRSENSGRFFVSQVLGGTSGMYSFSDCIFETHGLEPDGRAMMLQAQGNLSLRNVIFGLSANGPKANIFASPPGTATLHLDGVVSANTLDGFLSGLRRPNVTAIVHGYAQEQLGVGKIASVDGIATNGPLRSLGDGGGELDASGGSLTWNPTGGKPTTLAARDTPSARDAGAVSGDLRVGGNLVVGGSVKASSVDLGEGRQWTPDGLFMDKDRYWTPDGLYPGMLKWRGSGTLMDGPDESLRFVGWSEDKKGNRRQGFVVPPLRGK